MPFCQNPPCSRQNLHKDEVEFDERRQLVLCIPCYKVSQVAPPQGIPVYTVPTPTSGLRYGLHLTSERGLEAELHYGELAVGFQFPISEMNRMLNGG